VSLAALILACALAFAASDTVRFVVLSTYGELVYGFPSETDRANAEMIRDKITSVHHFALDSRSTPGQPPVFVDVGSKQLLRAPTIVHVYDVESRSEQDAIAAALQQLTAEKHLPPFNLCFYDYENWIQSGGFGERRSENQLRCLHIAEDRVREISGRKVITYPSP
jgi:hypothetical protein